MIRNGIRRAFRLALHRERQWQRDVDDEIELHLALRAEQLIAEGLPREKAIEEAVRRFGRPEESRARLIEAARHREQSMRRVEFFETLRRDMSFALRSLRRQKGWTAVTVATIALGIGATTAVFSVVSSVLLHPLPYPNAGRIVFVYQQPSAGNNTGISVRITPAAPVVRAWKHDVAYFEAVEAYRTSQVALRTNGEPITLNAAMIEPTFPAFAGQRPMRGRMFTAGEIAASAPVVLIGEQTWRTRFGGDTSIIGKTIWVNDSALSVIGIMPATLETPNVGAQPRDLWLPLDLRNNNLGVNVIARLRPGARLAEVQRELDSSFARSGGFVGSLPFRAIVVTPAQSVDFHDSLIMLMGAVGLVLLVAFADVAHLVIARTTSRDREMAIRVALGAGRRRLFWQLLTESLLLTGGGALCGVLVGWAALRLLIGLRPQSLSKLAMVHLDATTLAVALALAVIGGVGFGVVGVLHSRRESTGDTLKGGRPNAPSHMGRSGASGLLIVSEMALSTTLVVCATMVIRSVINLQQADLGFVPKNLYAINITASKSQYGTAVPRTAIKSQVIARLRQMPGVRSAAVTGNGPGSRSFAIGRLEIEGEPVPTSDASAFIDENGIETEYFRAMGIRLLAGTVFTDTTAGARQVIINGGFARAHWPDVSPVGHRLRVGSMSVRSTQPDTQPWLTIVGVVADALTGGAPAESKAPMLYLPSEFDENSTLMLRTAADVDPTAAIRSVARSIDPRLVTDVMSVEREMSGSLAQPRFIMLLLSIFTGMALVLSAIGLYGVMAFGVARRTKEIGIRVALGASVSQIGRAVVARGVALAVVGAAVGVIVAMWGTKLIEHELYGVTRSDLSSFVVGVTALLAAATLACIVPMRRAVAVDPIRAIRTE